MNQATRCGEVYAYDGDGKADAVGSPAIAWSLGRSSSGAGAPSGMSVDPSTGAVSWTPDAKTFGPTRVTLVAQNEAGAAEQDFLVQVDCPGAAKPCGCAAGDFAPAVLLALLALRRRRR